MAGNDYKAAYEALVNTINQERDLWAREAESFKEQAFKDGLEQNYISMRVNESLQERYEAMADQCEYLLKQAAEFEGVCHEQVNENGRVSLHLIDSNTERCVYDLNCNPSEVPARVWSEILDTVSGTVSRVGSQADHIHEVRMNGFFGVPIWYVHLVGERYYWVNDDDKVVSGPEIWEAWYRDTAFATC